MLKEDPKLQRISGKILTRIRDEFTVKNKAGSSQKTDQLRFDFYAEVHLNNDTNQIERIRTFKSIEPLEPYLDGIDLSELG